MNELGKKVREVRILRRMTQTELGEKCGYKSPRAMIYQIETGLVEPPLNKVKELAKALGVSAAYLAGYEDPSEGRSIFLQEFEALNHDGQALAIEYIRMLLQNAKYAAAPVIEPQE